MEALPLPQEFVQEVLRGLNSFHGAIGVGFEGVYKGCTAKVKVFMPLDEPFIIFVFL